MKKRKKPANHRKEKSEKQMTRTASNKIRYAVVGLGHIAQAAVLPAFKHAGSNSELTALISGDPTKLKKLGRRYEVTNLFNYGEYRKALEKDLFDVVYIALPNTLHREFAIEAAHFGKHVLCQKPLSVTAQDCRDMIQAAQRNNVKLMTAYRLHFQRANMEMVNLVQSGKIGEPKIFTSSFSYQIKPNNSRLRGDLGGGPLYDIGIYCINAARYIFRDEPWEVSAVIPETNDRRFQEVEATVSATMRFSGGRIAQFTCSFALEPTSWYEALGTKGCICVDSAYEYTEDMECKITIGEKTSTRTYRKCDQFAPEIIYFSDCVRHDLEPEPSGLEGLADVRIIEALFESARKGYPIQISHVEKHKRPGQSQVITRPAIPREPPLIHAEGAS